jgi:hypothetical protein
MNVYAIDTDNASALHAIAMAVRSFGAGVADTADNPAPADNRQTTGVCNGPTAISHVYPYALSGNSVRSHPSVLFNKTPEQLRRIGSLGGKAHGRNHRARRALMPLPPPAVPRARATESTVAAIATLDAQFPWLRSAEKRRRKLHR